MSAKDLIHDAIKNALVKDGWVITDDPYVIAFEEVTLYADLGAERPFAAQRGMERIVVEVKSFIRRSFMQDLKEAIEQYVIYLSYLEESEPERKLFLAVAEKVYDEFFRLKAVQFIMERHVISLIGVNLNQEEIIKWIN